MDAELVLVGAAIGVSSVRLDVIGRGLEVAEREGLVGGFKAGFTVGLSNGIGPLGVDMGAGLGFATVGCGAGGWFAERPQSASLPDWPATGDSHPSVLSLTGDPQPPPSGRGEPQPSSFQPTGDDRSPLFWGGEPHPPTVLLAVEVDRTRLVTCGRLVREDLEVGADDMVVGSFQDVLAEAGAMGGSRAVNVEGRPA